MAAAAQNYPNKYIYERLHSNYTESGNRKVDVIIRVDNLQINKPEKASVAVTLDEKYYEVLIYEKGRKKNVIKRYRCAENTTEYDTEKFEIIYAEHAVHLKLTKKTDDRWSVTEA